MSAPAGGPRLRQAAYGLVRRAAGTLGYEVIAAWRLEHREMAQHLSALFERLEIGSVLDVGANTGQYRDFLRREVGFSGHIASFEPVAALAEGLRRRASDDPRWDVFRLALGADEGERPINVTTNTTFTSFLTPDRTAARAFAAADPVARTEIVPVRRLDTVLGELGTAGDRGNIYLKMDTQGYDLEVIRGAPAALARIAALQTEASIIPIYRGMPDWLTVYRVLHDAGFDITGMFPVSRDRNLRLVEFDCVMINRSRLRA